MDNLLWRQCKYQKQVSANHHQTRRTSCKQSKLFRKQKEKSSTRKSSSDKKNIVETDADVVSDGNDKAKKTRTSSKSSKSSEKKETSTSESSSEKKEVPERLKRLFLILSKQRVVHQLANHQRHQRVSSRRKYHQRRSVSQAQGNHQIRRETSSQRLVFTKKQFEQVKKTSTTTSKSSKSTECQVKSKTSSSKSSSDNKNYVDVTQEDIELMKEKRRTCT